MNALSPRHALASPIPVFSCFFADSASSIPGLTISSTHIPPRSRGAFCAPRGFAPFASLTRIEGWAERRETFGCVRSTRWARHLASKTRVNALMTRHARRLRGALRPIARQDARERAYGSTSLRAAPRPGHASDAFVALFTFQTAHLIPAAHFASGVCIVASLTPNRGVGGAPRNVRVRARHPLGVS